MIRLEGIERVYEVGEELVHALDGIDETIERGEHIAIMGPSGSGKSTLLNVIGLLDRPTAGRYLLDDADTSTLGESELSRLRGQEIGFVFQSYHLVPRLDALGNVELPMLLAGIGRGERRKRARAALEAVDLAPRLHHRPDQLSGGERQRVAIARATAMEPKVLLADEPTGNLDSRAGAQVLELLESLNRAGLTLIVVTHDPGVARRAGRVLVMADGKIVHRLPGAEMTDLGRILAGRSP